MHIKLNYKLCLKVKIFALDANELIIYNNMVLYVALRNISTLYMHYFTMSNAGISKQQFIFDALKKTKIIAH